MTEVEKSLTNIRIKSQRTSIRRLRLQQPANMLQTMTIVNPYLCFNRSFVGNALQSFFISCREQIPIFLLIGVAYGLESTSNRGAFCVPLTYARKPIPLETAGTFINW